MHLSIPFLQEIRSKKVVLDIHDTFFLADDCDCKKCEKNQKSSIKMWGGIFDSKSNKHELCLQKKNVLDSISANLLTHSDYFKRFVAESVVTKDQPRVDVVRFGVDTNAYKNTHNQKELRAKYHIPEKNLVLFCRALSERKGIESIETALQNLELENVTVLTCSETGLLESVSDKYQVIERGEASQDELIQLFNVCDIFLCPSSEESFGFMAIEAMSCEKPTIIFDGTALPYTTFAPDCGYLVPQGDDVALMKAIVYLAKNPDERRRRGKLGRKLAKEHYDISKYYENLGTFYEKILNEAPRVVPEIVEKFEIDENAKNLISKLKEVYERLELKTKFTEVFPEFDVKLPVKKSQKPIEYSSDNTQALLRYFNKNLYKIIKKESKVLPSMVRKIKRIRRPRSALKT